MRQLSTAFAKDTRGNYAIVFAVLLLPLLAGIGLVIDFTKMNDLRTKAMQVGDTALMAAAASVRESGKLEGLDPKAAQAAIGPMLKDTFRTFYDGNAAQYGPDLFGDYDVRYDPATTVFSVAIRINYTPIFASYLGSTDKYLKVRSSVKTGFDPGGALSMDLVLDKSGSMSGDKIAALKSAVQTLVDDFAKNDPESKYIRLGAVAYDSSQFGATGIGWDRTAVSGFVSSLAASGGTASTSAVKTAHQELRHPREQAAHTDKSGQTASKVMVFMTDGDNNNMKDDTLTKSQCDKAKGDNIVIYTIAFQAPARGQALLGYCASSPAHYFDAGDSAALVAAFRQIGKGAAKMLSFSQ